MYMYLHILQVPILLIIESLYVQIPINIYIIIILLINIVLIIVGLSRINQL